MKRDLPRRTWRYSKPPLLIALPHKPQKPGGEGEVGGAAELDGANVPSSEKADHRQTPLDEKGLG